MTTDTIWALNTPGVISDGGVLFTGLWNLMNVLIAVHMGDISALLAARSLK